MKIPTLLAVTIFSILLILSSNSSAQQFHPQLSTALASSHETGKPVVVVFSASWCAPCKMMLKNVYPSSQVMPFHDQFVWAYLDIDQAANRHIMTEMKVSSVPHLAFIGSDGLPIAQIAGTKTPDEFATILSVVLKKNRSKASTDLAENQKNQLIRTPQVVKPTKQIFSGLLKKKKNSN